MSIKKEVNGRGFAELVGEVVVSVDTTAINVVRIKTASGKVVEVSILEVHYGIPVICAEIEQKA